MTLKVLICDDKKAGRRNALQAAKDGGEDNIDVVAAEPNDLAESLQVLFSYVTDSRKPSFKGQKCGTIFDRHDLVIIDNDLTQLDFAGAPLTVESIAAYIRAYSDCNYIVSINRNPAIDFDLARLVGDPETLTDLSINTQHLAHRTLWRGPTVADGGEFAPWYWPPLLEATRRRRKQVDSLKGKLDDTILKFFGFGEKARAGLSDRAVATLTPKGERGRKRTPADKVTFREFFLYSCRSLTPDDRRTLSNRERDDVIARIVAAELDVWFRRDVLAPQEVLVDLPHLLMRMPFLLGADPSAVKNWDAVVGAGKAPFALSKALFDDHLQKYMFEGGDWCPHPALWWADIKADEALAEAARKEEKALGDFVFCEDISRFKPRKPTGKKTAPREFSIDSQGIWERRHVAIVEDYAYAPRVNFAI